MYYVYFLKSFVNGDLYVGSCENVDVRFKRHNSGSVKSTKAYRPWKMLGFEEYNTRADAMAKEKFYKRSSAEESFKRKV